jgi:hypothetical protein
MKTAFRHAALTWIVAFATVAMPALAEDKPLVEPLYEVALDVDSDGRMDRAAIVERPDSRQADLYIYQVAGDQKLDLSRQPTFLKREITEGRVDGLESRGNGSLVIISCFGCGAIKSWAETLTIVHRGGEFLVAGYARDWDWNSHMADGTVNTIMGSCEIDFLAGRGAASDGLDDAQPVEGTFTPVKLSDWSADERPDICNF